MLLKNSNRSIFGNYDVIVGVIGQVSGDQYVYFVLCREVVLSRR